MNKPHIRNERATRERFGRLGDGKDLPDSICVAWCGADASGQFFLLGADHAFMSLAAGSSVEPCRRCLRRLRALIDAEIGARTAEGADE